MKNRIIRLVSLLLSLVIFASGLPVFAEDDYELVIAETDTTAILPAATPEPTAIPDDELEVVAAETPTPFTTEETTAEPTVEVTAMPTEEATEVPVATPAAESKSAPAVESTPEPTIETTVEPTTECTAEPPADATAEPTVEPTPEPTLAPTEEPAVQPTAEATPESEATPVVEAAETSTPEPSAEPELTPEPTEEIIIAETIAPAEDTALIQTAQELADAFGFTVEELSAALEIPAEELEQMSPEELTAIYEVVLEMRSGMMTMSVEPEFIIDENNQLTAYLGEGGAIEVPEGVTAIAGAAFMDCASITSVKLPEGLESIGAAAFMNCSALQEIEIPAGVKFLPGLESTVDFYTFANCGSLTKVVLPEGIEAIGSGMFAQCKLLKEINVPDSVKRIEASAFVGCESLELIKLSVAVEEIADDAFEGCALLTMQVSKGSYAETYCIDKQLPYVYFDSTVPAQIIPACDSLVIGVQEKVSVAGWSLMPAGTVDTVTYSSDSSRVASVNADGLVTGKIVGKTVIRLTTAGGLAAEIKVEVKKAPTSVSIKGLRKTLGLNEELQPGYSLSSGSAGSVVFSSSNKAVADFLPDGALIAVGVGTAKITAKTYNGKQKTMDIRVVPEPRLLTLSFEDLILGVDDTRVLKYTLDEGSAGAVVFESTDSDVLQAEQDGTLTAIQPGAADVVVKAYNGVSAVCRVEVVHAPESIVFTDTRKTMGVGEKIQLNAVMSPEETKSVIKYKSSNTKVATVNASGVVTAKRTGKTTIKATTYNGKSASYVITVKNAPKSVSLSASRKVIGVLEEIQLGYKLNSGSSGKVSFKSLNEDIAVVSEDGLLKGVSIGFANIEVRTYNNKYKRVKFEVKAAPESVTPVQTEIIIGEGDSYTLGYHLNEGSAGAVGFASDTPDVVGVDTVGKLTAHAVGEAVITIESYNHVVGSTHVTVVPAPEEITLSAARKTIGIGEKLHLIHAVTPVVTVGTIKYKSSNKKVASVSGSGIVTARRAGKATITATAHNGISATYTITVKKAPTSVNLTTPRKVIGLGEELQLGYKLNSGSNGAVSFKSLNAEIATVTADGLLKGEAVGFATIEVRTYNNKYKRVKFEVKPAPTEITPGRTEVVIGAGDSYTLGYALNDGSAGAVSFASDNQDVVGIDATGKLTAHAVGEAKITLESYNQVAVDVPVQVVPAPEGVVLAAARKNIGIGEKLQLTVSISPVETVGTIKYKSSNTKIATVNANGVVTAKKAGNVTITATTYNGLSAKYSVAVKKAPTSISLVSSRKVIGLGEELQLGYKLNSGSNGAVSFKSLNAEIATVTADGLLKGETVGFATIEVRTYNNKYKRVKFEVKPAPTEITPGRTEVVIGAGDSYTLGYALNEGSAGAVSFASDAANVVEVDAKGKLYAREPGEATIALETYNHVSTGVRVTVVPAPEAIILSAGRKTIGVAEKLQMNWEVIPEVTVGTIKYKSSNTRVATVNGNGLVTAKRAGKATITATTYNGFSSACTITVKNAPKSISLVASRKTIGLGEELQLGYKLNSGSNGAASFRSLNTAVATVTTDGLLKGVAIGNATIEVRTYNGKYKRVNFNVKAAPTLVVPAKPDASIGVGDAWTLGYALDDGAAGGVTFASSDPAVADVDAAGKITAFAEGVADVTISTYNQVSATCRVTVVPEPAGIDLSTVPATIGLNESVQLNPMLSPENTVSALRFSSSKSSVVKVNSKGVITGKKVGTANITVKAYNGVSQTVKVRVVSAPKSVKLSTERSVVALGETFQFTAKLSKGSAGDYWFESSDENVILVHPETGAAVAVAEGEAVVRAVTYNNRKSEIRMKVLPEPTSMTIVPGYAAVGVGDTIQLSASVNEGSTGTYRFESLNPEIATVGEFDGTVNVHAEGTAKIAVEAYNSVSATMELQALPAPTHISVIEPGLSEGGFNELTMDKGSSFQIAVDKGEYTQLDLTFTSDNPSIATVSASGLITAKRAGATMIRVSTYNGVFTRILVTVQLLTDRYPVKTIMHAMGAVNGRVYSNSKEAFLANYANGHRFFEVDFSYTSDKKLVLWHSWKSNRVSSKLKAGYVPTYKQFMSQKVFDKYTPLDLAALLELMDAYPDAYIFMDTKLTGASDVRKQYKTIVSTAKNMGLEHVLDRMVVMIYNKTMYSVVNSIHPFRQYVFMMYKTFSKAPTASQVRSIAAFCHANSIEYISMWDSWWKPSFMAIADEYGLEVNLHTINSTSKAKAYVEDGVSLITSDYLSIKGY